MLVYNANKKYLPTFTKTAENREREVVWKTINWINAQEWSYCIGATGRDIAYALISMFLLTYIQYTMKLVTQYAVISAIIR